MTPRSIYWYTHFPEDLRCHLEAGAFRSICRHLSERSDEVQNINLMITGGFSRNCLAKWLVGEARRLAEEIRPTSPKDAALLDAYGHSQAARDVYGCDFFKWKMKHNRKPTFQELQQFQASESIHAVHKEDKQLKTGMTLGMTEVYESKFKQQVEAGGFRSLVKHLQDRSDSVQNIDLMTISGFCRNCLAKWLVIEARKLASTVRSVCGELSDEEEKLVKDLDAFGYDEAAEYVYGCTYPEWKKEHQKKATEDQMARYNASSKIHAVHDKKMLETRGEKGPASFEAKDISSTQSPSSNLSADNPTSEASISTSATNHEKTKGEKSVILSDVCCEDVDVSPNTAPSTLSSNGSATCSTTYRTPPPPSNINLSLRVGILTVSDRAANGEYEHGDLSGPAVEQSLTDNMSKANARRNKTDTGSVNINYIVKAIVPDEIDRIKNQLLQWCGSNGSGSICDVIFTTGGTGFNHRDVTPEATKEILEKDASGLMTFVLAQCAAIQPLAVLSRGIVGIRGRTLIVNIPGNPRAAEQVLDVLFPFILYAIKDLIKE